MRRPIPLRRKRPSRLPFVVGLALLLSMAVPLAVRWYLQQAPDGESPLVIVHHDPTCRCCLRWIEHLAAAGFRVRSAAAEPATDVRARLGVPPTLAACHTATVGPYVIEGHVPAADIRRLLRERPAVRGLAVPDMPEGSPGMEGPNAKPYDVRTIEASGESRVFSTHDPRVEPP